jgi:hypothetical protein
MQNQKFQKPIQNFFTQLEFFSLVRHWSTRTFLKNSKIPSFFRRGQGKLEIFSKQRLCPASAKNDYKVPPSILFTGILEFFIYLYISYYYY